MTNQEIDKITTFFKTTKNPTLDQIDSLLTLKSQVIRVSRIHKRTKSKKLIRYQIVVITGSPEVGIIGIGVGKKEEYRLALKEAINKSKRKLKMIQKGCGYLDCSCKDTLKHSLTKRSSSKVGTTRVTLVPTTYKRGLRGSPSGKKLLSLVGIQDLIIISRGNKNNKLNMVKAIYEAI